MVPDDVYELTGVADPRLSPDGKTVAYSHWWIDRDANDYRAAIWLVPADGSSAPRRFTTSDKKDDAPRWSPDGSRIAFVSNREKEESQLYVIPIAGGEPIRLTDLKTAVHDHTWSPDGSHIAFVARVPDIAYEQEDEKKRSPRRFTRLQFKLDNEGWIGDRRAHVFVVAADGSSPPVQITKGDYEHAFPAWSPDGRSMAFVSARADDWDIAEFTDVYVAPADGGDPRAVTEGDGRCDAPSWSPDGTRIGYLYTPGVLDEPHHGQIATVDVSSGERRILTSSLDRNCAPYPTIREPVWSGEDVIFAVEDGGNTHLYRVPADGSGKPELMVGGELVLTGFDAAGGTVIHSRSTPTTLSELHNGDEPLTSVGRAFTDGREIVAPERFTAVSADGSEVDAWILRPAGFEPGRTYPVLLNIHGGPFTQYGNKLFDEFQMYAGAGYVVLFSNPRGSSGNSEEWGRAIRGPASGGPGMGTVDYEDCMAVVDEALRRYEFCDAERLGVMGGSYGGYMTSWIVGHSDRFKAAISERSVNAWTSMHGSSDIGWSFKSYVGAFQFEDPQAWEQISPQTHATAIHTPLLIMHSENDLRANIEQAEQLFTTLRLLRRPVEMVRFPGEGHELTRSGSPAHRVMRFEIVLEWFARHLKI